MDESIFERLGRVTTERDAAVAEAKIEKTRADGHYENYCQILKRIDVVLNERDEARAESDRLTGLVETLTHQLEVSRSATQRLADELADPRIKHTRPEPSRLEIAAMGMQGFLSSNGFQIDVPKLSLTYADALIAAAKEAK